MEKINFKKDKIPFTQVANQVLNDKRLSAKAKGLYSYLYSKPDGWHFSTDRIAEEFSDGRKSIATGLQELEKTGYLQREKQSTGRVIYTLKSQMPKKDIRQITPHKSAKPNAHFGTVPKRHSAEMGIISNKEYKVIKSISNTMGGEASSPLTETPKQDSAVDKEPAAEGYDVPSEQITEVIYRFTQVDIKNKLHYKNTNQRKAAAFLIGEYGYEAVLKRVDFLPQSNKMKFFPSITSPVELRERWVKLEDAVIKYKKEHSKPKAV